MSWYQETEVASWPLAGTVAVDRHRRGRIRGRIDVPAGARLSFRYLAQAQLEALREQGQTVWYMNALNEGHGYRKKENRHIYQQATVLFLRTHLLGE